MNRIGLQVKLDAAQHLLRHIAEDYYTGCKTYHILAAVKAPERVHWHGRLKTLTQTGSNLADALGAIRPPWELLYHLAARDPHSRFNPFQAGGGCLGCLHGTPGGLR